MERNSCILPFGLSISMALSIPVFRFSSSWFVSRCRYRLKCFCRRMYPASTPFYFRKITQFFRGIDRFFLSRFNDGPREILHNFSSFPYSKSIFANSSCRFLRHHEPVMFLSYPSSCSRASSSLKLKALFPHYLISGCTEVKRIPWTNAYPQQNLFQCFKITPYQCYPAL